MSTPISLVTAILGEAAPSETEAVTLLEAAARQSVDAIDRCTHRYGLGPADAMQRAAAWAGLRYAPTVPRAASRHPWIGRIDALAEVRTIRARQRGAETVYCAPRYAELVALAGHVEAHPELRDRVCLVPIGALRQEIARAHEELLIEEARQRLARRWPFASAHLDLPLRARAGFVAGVITLALVAALAPFWSRPLFVPLVGVLLVVPALFRLLAACRRTPPEAGPPPLPDDAELPVYSVLIPLRDEAHMVPLLERAMRALDYPPEKLDIKFVVEERSESTVAAVRRILGEPSFELVVVPDAPPHTKPKALDYALPLVRGEYVVVYDAEDIPAPDQLRHAAGAFVADPGLDCLQAELTVDNAAENWLTALFAGEYAGQFGVMLPFLAAHRLPMPLGGTSNHFRTRSLRELGGWDAFNVTEDADLGTRMARLRYRSATLASHTREEAPITLGAWMAQRTRWMKGWAQTFIVHNRDPRRFLADIGWRGFLAFEIYIGSMLVSALLHSVVVAGLLAALLSGHATLAGMDAWDGVGLLVLLVGYGGAVALAVAGLLRLGRPELLAYQVLLPVYWVLHTIATVRALHELLTRPYFWAKTGHGRTRMRRSAEPAPGRAPASAIAREAEV
ncbi:glycosyltransferase family 2 protein [Devosia sp.]|uniref:glycosyltransferase family 2 protein n=1 Tax=Devosia sp. TaxID=1871048 RepID=UPI002EEFAF99